MSEDKKLQKKIIELIAAIPAFGVVIPGVLQIFRITDRSIGQQILYTSMSELPAYRTAIN